MFCQQCGHPCSPAAPCCPRCGGPVGQVGPVAAEAAEPHPPTPPEVAGAPGVLDPEVAPGVGTGKPSQAEPVTPRPRPEPEPGASPSPAALASPIPAASPAEVPNPGPGKPTPTPSARFALAVGLGALVLAVAGAALWWYQSPSGHGSRAATTGTITPLQGTPVPSAQAPFDPTQEPLPVIPEQDRRVVTVIPKGSTQAAPPTLWEHRQWVAKLRQGPAPASCTEAARRLRKLHPLPENQARATLVEAFPDLCGTPSGERTPPAHPNPD